MVCAQDRSVPAGAQFRRRASRFCAVIYKISIQVRTCTDGAIRVILPFLISNICVRVFISTQLPRRVHVYTRYTTGCADINTYSDKGVYTRRCTRTYRHASVCSCLYFDTGKCGSYNSICAFVCAIIRVFVHTFSFY